MLSDIFKAYDVRGIYPADLNEERMEQIGRAFVDLVRSPEILIGCDMRISTPQLKYAFLRGAMKQGARVIDLGQISTDCLYFASGKYNLPGAMITASHNPKEWNGVKFCRAGAEPIGQDTGLAQMQEFVVAGMLNDTVAEGSIAQKDGILEEFREHCHNFVDKTKMRPLRVVVDAGNGMAGKIVPAVFAGLPTQIIPLFFELDGNFPNHQPSPIEKKNNLQLIEKVREVKADLGLAFDGDADRVFFIDETGKMLDSSFVTAMIAKKILEKNPNGAVVYSVTVSKAVPEFVEKMGGKAILTKVGHSFIKQVMKESSAVFGGEHSGHYYFQENFRADSGIIAALIVLEMLSESGGKMSELIREFQTYHKIEETNLKVENAAAMLEKLHARFGANLTQKFDGATFDFGDWWFNVRPSNTEPVLRLNLEAKTRKVMEEKVGEILQLIREIGE
jgi:phosphomannomutase